MSSRLRIAISPCPNDVFAFHGLLDGAVDAEGLELDFELLDVEAANRAFAAGRLDAAKVSFHAALDFAADAVLLDAGSAIGYGVGPIVLAREGLEADGGKLVGRVLLPGEHTTAALLKDLYHRGEGRAEHLPFSRIIPALVAGDADFGVCIHEARFTWRRHRLRFHEDLGLRWHEDTGLPLPLGGIVARKALGDDVLGKLARATRRSIEHANAVRARGELAGSAVMRAMRDHAQELDDDAIGAHVATYVTADTLELSELGEIALRELARRARRLASSELSIVRARPLTTPRLFRVLRADDARALDEDRELFGARSLAGGPFVHLSFAAQLAGTLAVHFADEPAVTIVEVDRVRTRGTLRLEPSRGGELFPHLYRALEPEDVLARWPRTRRDGRLAAPRLAERRAEDPEPGARPPRSAR